MSEMPSFARWLEAQRGKNPSARVPWSALEEAELAREVREQVPWRQIALRHGRSVKAVQLRARKLAGDGQREQPFDGGIPDA